MTQHIIEIHIVKKKLDVSDSGVGRQISKETDSHNRIFTNQSSYMEFLIQLEKVIAGAK